MHRWLLTGSALAVLAFSGAVHGLWTYRWSDQEDLKTAAARLDAVPLAFGNWQGETIPRDPDPRTGLAGSIARKYVQVSTGKVVTLYIGCGRSGPAAPHTPDDSYDTKG